MWIITPSQHQIIHISQQYKNRNVLVRQPFVTSEAYYWKKYIFGNDVINDCWYL